ncbi:MAG TPA: hypothetical protein VGA27_01085 [Candidatus Binatia bacterium]
MLVLFLGLLILDGGVDVALGSAVTAITNGPGQVVIDKIEAESYLIPSSEAQRAFIYKQLLSIADETAALVTPGVPSPVQKSATNIEVKETAKQPSVSTSPTSSLVSTTTAPTQALPTPVTKAPSAAAQPAAPKAVAAKPQSILQMIEGHEAEFKIGVLIAVGSFVLGWICGGSYYVRRERKRRGKLRF